LDVIAVVAAITWGLTQARGLREAEVSRPPRDWKS
jgi:hypothetical protein